MSDFDVAIIGGGTAGYSAALRSAENGLKIALIEKEKLGGTCLHKGCIPTKALIEASSNFSKTNDLEKFGINLEDVSINWAKTQDYKAGVVGSLYDGLKSLIKSYPIDLVNGEAHFNSDGSVSVDGSTINAENLIVATGSRPRNLTFLPDSPKIINSDQLLELQEIPGSMTIIGGGYIGIEFASLFNNLGTNVTILEAGPDILAGSDSQLRKMLSESLKKRGVRIETGIKIENVEDWDADVILVAVGRAANTQGLGLEEVGIDLDSKGFIKVNENLMSTAQNVFAIGDCINTPQLAHVSFAEGIAVADFIANGQASFPNYDAVPSVIYSDPQLASVGLTEEAAKANGNGVKSALYNFAANSKAVISKEVLGLSKIVADENDTILGIHILGDDAANLISEAMLAVGWEAKAQDVANFIHPHPTYSEVIGEAAMKLTGKPLHSL